MCIIKAVLSTAELNRDTILGILCCFSNIAIRKSINLHSICKTFSIYNVKTKRPSEHNTATSKGCTIYCNWWLKPWPGTWREFTSYNSAWDTWFSHVRNCFYNRLWYYIGSHILQWQGWRANKCISCILFRSWFDNNYTEIISDKHRN